MPIATLDHFMHLIRNPEGDYTVGLYLNPKGMSKDEWLKKHGSLIATDLFGDIKQFDDTPDEIEKTWKHHAQNDNAVICLVDNGGFMAAGLAFSAREMAAFDHPCGRTKEWYTVPVSAIREEDPALAQSYCEMRDAALKG